MFSRGPISEELTSIDCDCVVVKAGLTSSHIYKHWGSFAGKTSRRRYAFAYIASDRTTCPYIPMQKAFLVSNNTLLMPQYGFGP